MKWIPAAAAGTSILKRAMSTSISAKAQNLPMSIEELYAYYLKSPFVCTDTRAITPGCIFFALKGDSFNGNAFAGEALSKGAAYAVVDESAYKNDERLILMPDALEALQHLANYHRRQLKCPVVAITGSNGKTTTKELISRVLAKKFRTHFTKGNLNNHIGVPLTILAAPADTQMLVVEMGANHQKEIEMLCAVAMPDYGIINNVGKAHLEGFGGFEGVKKGKGELYEFLALHHGCAFVNGDNAHLTEMMKAKNVKRRIVYGTGASADCRGRLLASFPYLKVEWNAGRHQGIINTQLVGDYNFENILAAVCIGNYFGVDAAQIGAAIESYVPDNSRSQIVRRGSNTVLMDAYNANPASMEAALKNFSLMDGKRKYVFLGEMAELGSESKEEHGRLVEMLGKEAFEKIILVGKNFAEYSSSLPAEYFETSAEAARWAAGQSISGALVLIKGSRSSKMEAVLESL
jgi:UDP-N-acetylmuramoyl-tripeptide--D-alanyl-D-alanine ligase